MTDHKATLFQSFLSSALSSSRPLMKIKSPAIKIDEIMESIEALKNNKSPGTDGLTDELYKHFSLELAPFLLKTYLESISSETLPPTLSQGLLTLIPNLKKTFY